MATLVSTLLHNAEEGNLNEVSRLLADGVDANAANESGFTALFLASKNGHRDVVALLIKYGANVDVPDSVGWTPLIVAAVGKHNDVAHVLMEARANVNNCTTKHGMTALYIAASSNNAELVALLLQHHAAIDTATQEGKTPLSVALEKDHHAIVSLLHASVPYAVLAPSAPDIPAAVNGLLAAIEANAIPAIVHLIKTKSDVNDAGSAGMTPLCLAAHLSREAIVGMLLIANANPNQSNGLGQTPLSIAATTGDVGIVEMLLQDGADVNATDKDLNSPLLLAVQHGHERVMHRLFAANADATKRNTNSDTALTVAMTCCRRDAARIIYAAVAQPPSAIHPDEVIGKTKLSSGGHKCLVEFGHYRGEGVAIKSMLHSRDTPAITAEIDALDACKSPYLLQLRAITGSEEQPCMVTEYMLLGTLRDFLDKKQAAQALPKDFTAQQVLWVVANALADLHAHGFVHRDLTSHNVLLCGTNYIKVANLGDAKARLMDRTMSMLLWCAPEVLSGASAATAAADVYSLGVIMTELDSFQLPYGDLNLDVWALTDNIRNGRVRPAVSATCAPWYKALAESCMAFDATSRPTAETVVATLEQHWRPSAAPSAAATMTYAMSFPLLKADNCGPQYELVGLNDVE